MKKFALLAFAAATMGAAVFATADNSNSYYSCKGGYYSDTPANMRTQNCKLINIRTGAVVPQSNAESMSASGSLADQQMRLNQQMAAANKKIEESNAAVEKANAEAKAENCKAARMNLDNASRASAQNRAQLANKYQADINKFCN